MSSFHSEITKKKVEEFERKKEQNKSERKRKREQLQVDEAGLWEDELPNTKWGRFKYRLNPSRWTSRKPRGCFDSCQRKTACCLCFIAILGLLALAAFLVWKFRGALF